MTLMSTTTSATSEVAADIGITFSAKIHKTEGEGGAWLLIVASVVSTEAFAFTSYRHAQKHLVGIVGKDRIRMVRSGEEFSYQWTAPWKR